MPRAIEIPEGTSYYCYAMEPPMDHKYHMYGVTLKGDQGMLKAYAHHSALYRVSE